MNPKRAKNGTVLSAQPPQSGTLIASGYTATVRAPTSLTKRHCPQYTSAEFAKHLRVHNVTASMGRTRVCWDNALAESFFAALKNELVHRTVFATRDQARLAIAEYIEVFYNRQRLHSGLGYKTPLEVATEYQQNALLAA